MVVSEFGGHAADVHDVLTQCVRGDLAAAS
jgi:hypothetical protein